MENIQLKDEYPWPGRCAIAGVAVLSLSVFTGLLTAVPPLTAAIGGYLVFTMALITLIDLRHFIIPDVLSLPAIPMGLAASALRQPEGDWGAGFASGVSGALIGGGCFYLLRAAYFRYRGVEGLGLGDVKLAAVAGAWLGPAALAPACLAATLSAIGAVLLHALVRRTAPDARLHVPFGSFIAPVILVFWLAITLAPSPFW
jgi:leader peptidase (prepilin peptidase)/N-methyltransferase